jgi:nucleoside-diphosphate-sugar epimerase
VVVAGATGAIGKQQVPRLVAAGDLVHGMTRSESKQAMLHELGAVPVVADALDLDQVVEAMARAKLGVIVHQLTAIDAIGIGWLFAPEAGVVLMTELRDASNAMGKRELGWRPGHPGWRRGLAT